MAAGECVDDGAGGPWLGADAGNGAAAWGGALGEVDELEAGGRRGDGCVRGGIGWAWGAGVGWGVGGAGCG